MGLYFFHLDGPLPVEDDEGEEFSTLAEAIHAGQQTAEDFAANREPSDIRGRVLRVTDEDGLEVASFAISDFRTVLDS